MGGLGLRTGGENKGTGPADALFAGGSKQVCIVFLKLRAILYLLTSCVY